MSELIHPIAKAKNPSLTGARCRDCSYTNLSTTNFTINADIAAVKHGIKYGHTLEWIVDDAVVHVTKHVKGYHGVDPPF